MSAAGDEGIVELMGHQGREEGSNAAVFWGAPGLRAGCGAHGEQTGGLGFPVPCARCLPLTGTCPSGALLSCWASS